MRLTVAAARALAEQVMIAAGHDTAGAALIADHLIDCELRGIHYGGLARALSIVERLDRTDHRRPMTVERAYYRLGMQRVDSAQRSGWTALVMQATW